VWVKFPKVGSAFASTVVGYACNASVCASTKRGVQTPAGCDIARARRVLTVDAWEPGTSSVVGWFERPVEARQWADRVLGLFRDPWARRRSEFLYFTRGGTNCSTKFGGFLPRALYGGVARIVCDVTRSLESRWDEYSRWSTPYRGCQTNYLVGRSCFSGTPSAGQTALALERVARMEFVGLQAEFAQSVCLFHARYGGVEFENEYDLNHTSAADGIASFPPPDDAADDPDTRTYLAAARRFRKDLAVHASRCSVAAIAARLSRCAPARVCEDASPTGVG